MINDFVGVLREFNSAYGRSNYFLEGYKQQLNLLAKM